MPRGLSISKQIEQKFIDPETGKSEIISISDVPHDLIPGGTFSGDGPWRNTLELGKKYKMFRFSNKYPESKEKCETKISIAWKNSGFTDKDLKKVQKDFMKLEFDKTIKKISAQFVKFYGFGEQVKDQGIRQEILREIKKLPCIVCGTTNNIECDHKNDLYLENDPRIRIKETQRIDDFQPLCRHCNLVKRQIKAKTIKENKRQPAPGFAIKFVEGDETFIRSDPNWYKGTYWGDVKAFKKKLGIC